MDILRVYQFYKLKKDLKKAKKRLERDMDKKWYKSKTLWTNIFGIVSIFTGVPVTPEVQVGILAVLNMALRAVTKEPVSF